MSRKNPPPTTSHARVRLFPMLWLALAAALCPAASNAQTQGQSPAQTPVIRPRTVKPKEEATPPAATPTQGVATPAQSAPAQSNAAPVQTNSAPSQSSPTQSDPSQTDEAVDENEVVRVESNIVIIPASVVDYRGRAITDLKVEDFELKVDGELKPIGDVSRTETPVNVALLFDNSASLSSAREFEKQAAVRFFQSVVRPIDRAAVYSISTMPTLSQGLTNDVPRLVRTIQNFGKPDGATALFDALAQAADYMRPLTGRKVLVLVSDGTDTVSDATFEEAIKRALLAECQIYVVQTRQVEDPNLHDTVSEQRMYKITEQTGGAVFVPQSVEELDAVFSQISLDISQQYLLSYNPQDERRDKYFRFISLRVKTRQNLRVRARKGFYPNAAQGGAQQQQQQDARTQTPPYTPTQTRAEYVAAVPTPRAPDANAQRRDASGGDASSASRRDSAASRKPGPDGPDSDERPKPAASEPEGQASFSLRTVAAASTPSNTTPTNVVNLPINTPTPEPPPAAPAPTPTPEVAATRPAARATPTPAPSPSEVSRPAPVDERARQKGPISGGVLNSKAVSLPRPNYPSAAKSVGAQGRVVIELMIDETGKVVKARAISGHPLLQKAAVAAALQARFSPTMLSGEPVSIIGTISYTFLLQ
ncbi:MAG: VWA domain-containing protein [Pyrinomonadaceae bacterium]